MKIEVRGENFELHPSRVLIWPEQKMLVVADIHLGKAQTFLKNGLWLPPQAHANDLDQLAEIANEHGLDHLLFLGDFVHSLEGVTSEVIEEFKNWKSNFLGTVTVVIGNHDRPLVNRWPVLWDFINLVESVQIKDFIFQHEPPEKKSDMFVWCGHIHPKISLKHAGDRMYLPAFVMTPDVGYLPAYSSLAGGAPFGYKKSNRYFVSSENKIVEVVF